MTQSTAKKLERPHFMIAEVGLTAKTVIEKFQGGAKSIKLLKGFVSTCELGNISAVKAIVFDGADTKPLAESQEAKTFLDEGGVLINIPYLSAETVLAKLNKVEELNAKIEEQNDQLVKIEEQNDQLVKQTDQLVKQNDQLVKQIEQLIARRATPRDQ